MARYPFIVKWGKELQSYDYYIVNQCYKAEADNAPENAIYERDGKWFTTNALKIIAFVYVGIYLLYDHFPTPFLSPNNSQTYPMAFSTASL